MSAGAAADNGRRPATVTVWFRGPEETIETSMVLGFACEDAVQTTLLTTTGSFDFGPTVAHSGHEMKKALSEHAEAVRTALASP